MIQSKPDKLPKGLALACVVIVAAAAGCSEEVVEAPAVVRPVKILEVGSGDDGRVREYPGFVRATQSAEIGFEVAGRVVRIAAKQGQRVQAGDVLAVLDDRDYVAQLDIERANVRKAEADLRRSESVYEQDPGAITVERIDGDRRALEVARARLAQSSKAVEDTVLRAPFDGVVSRRLIEVFENVQAKQPVVIVDDLEDIEVEINVPERDIGSPGTIAAGLTDEELDDLTRRFAPRVSISAVGNDEFPGRYVEVAARADAATRTFAIRIAFDPPAGVVILPGMTARVTASFDGSQGVSLPLSALGATPGGEPQVWVIDPATMTAHARVVTTGQVRNGTIDISAGLMPGELVATTGAKQLAEGMRVSRFEGSL
jgi:RND family efflux transporter MFP subunit